MMACDLCISYWVSPLTLFWTTVLLVVMLNPVVISTIREAEPLRPIRTTDVQRVRLQPDKTAVTVTITISALMFSLIFQPFNQSSCQLGL